MYGIPFVEPKLLPSDHRLLAKACIAAGMQGQLRPFSAALFRAIFAGSTVTDEGCLEGIADECRLDIGQFNEQLVSTTVDQKVSANAQEALACGAFGVPTFVLGEKLFWGNDRLPLLEHELGHG